MEQIALFIIIVTFIKLTLDLKCKKVNAAEWYLRHQRGLLHRTKHVAHEFCLYFWIPGVYLRSAREKKHTSNKIRSHLRSSKNSEETSGREQMQGGERKRKSNGRIDLSAEQHVVSSAAGWFLTIVANRLITDLISLKKNVSSKEM